MQPGAHRHGEPRARTVRPKARRTQHREAGARPRSRREDSAHEA